MNFRPEKNEYAEFYGGYVASIAEDDVMAVLRQQIDEMRSVVASLDDARGDYRYADGKWSIKDLLGHILDGERVFAYRILRFARADDTPLPGYDQDPYVIHNNAPQRKFTDLFEEFELLRRANIKLIENLDETALMRSGTASGNPVSVRALVTILAGHVRHHLNVLNERYLAAN